MYIFLGYLDLVIDIGNSQNTDFGGKISQALKSNFSYDTSYYLIGKSLWTVKPYRQKVSLLDFDFNQGKCQSPRHRHFSLEIYYFRFLSRYTLWNHIILVIC